MIDLSDEIRKSYEESTTQYDKIKKTYGGKLVCGKVKNKQWIK